MSIEISHIADPFARAFLVIVVLATVAIQVWIALGMRSRGSDSHKSSRKQGVRLMATGEITFFAAVQVGAASSFVAGPIAMWPHAAKLCVELLAYTGIAIVLLGMIMNLKNAFR